jgi:lipoprotein-releasing system ATP-binding protein
MLVEVSNLTKSHPSPGGGKPVDILRGLDFEMDAGGTVAILGPSGSGKSTLLNILGALDKGDSGVVRVNGLEPGTLKGKDLVDFRRRSVGIVFQMHHLLPQCTVLENVLVPSIADRRQARINADANAREMLDAMGLAHRLAHRPSELSGGERQRVAVARAMAGSPRLLLADEPTGALDRASATQLADALLELNRVRKVALFVVTHSRDLAMRMEQVWELVEGKLVRAS